MLMTNPEDIDTEDLAIPKSSSHNFHHIHHIRHLHQFPQLPESHQSSSNADYQGLQRISQFPRPTESDPYGQESPLQMQRLPSSNTTVCAEQEQSKDRTFNSLAEHTVIL